MAKLCLMRGLNDDSLNKDKVNIIKQSILMNIQETLMTIQEKSGLIFKLCVLECLHIECVWQEMFTARSDHMYLREGRCRLFLFPHFFETQGLKSDH